MGSVHGDEQTSQQQHRIKRSQAALELAVPCETVFSSCLEVIRPLLGLPRPSASDVAAFDRSIETLASISFMNGVTDEVDNELVEEYGSNNHEG